MHVARKLPVLSSWKGQWTMASDANENMYPPLFFWVIHISCCLPLKRVYDLWIERVDGCRTLDRRNVGKWADARNDEFPSGGVIIARILPVPWSEGKNELWPRITQRKRRENVFWHTRGINNCWFFCTAAVKGLLTICFDRILAGNRELDEYNRKSNWLGSSVTVWVLGRELGNSWGDRNWSADQSTYPLWVIVDWQWNQSVYAYVLVLSRNLSKCHCLSFLVWRCGSM